MPKLENPIFNPFKDFVIPPKWNTRQLETLNTFSRAGIATFPYFYQMLGPDRADAAANLIVDHGELLKEAILSGRTSQTPRFAELSAAISAMKQSYERVHGAVVVGMVAEEFSKYTNEFGESIPDHFPQK